MTTVFITGATDGPGKALAPGSPPRVRADPARAGPSRLGQTGIEVGAAATGPRVRTVPVDLSDLGQVRRLAATLDLTSGWTCSSATPASARRLAGRSRGTSVDGYELRFAVNTRPGSGPPGPARPAPGVRPGPRRPGLPRGTRSTSTTNDRTRNGGRAYGRASSPRSCPPLARRRLPASEATVNSLHPVTYMPTKMVLEEVGHHIDTRGPGAAATGWSPIRRCPA